MHINESSKYNITLISNTKTHQLEDYIIIKLSVYYGMKKNDNSTPISDLKKDFEKDKNMTRHRLLSVGIEEIRLQ